jgi:hypothetical protein
MFVVNRASITVTHTFAGGPTSFSRKMQVGFVPDEVIVRQVSYTDQDQAIYPDVIQTDLVKSGDGIICHLMPSCVFDDIYFSMSWPNSTFQVQKIK